MANFVEMNVGRYIWLIPWQFDLSLFTWDGARSTRKSFRYLKSEFFQSQNAFCCHKCRHPRKGKRFCASLFYSSGPVHSRISASLPYPHSLCAGYSQLSMAPSSCLLSTAFIAEWVWWAVETIMTHRLSFYFRTSSWSSGHILQSVALFSRCCRRKAGEELATCAHCSCSRDLHPCEAFHQLHKWEKVIEMNLIICFLLRGDTGVIINFWTPCPILMKFGECIYEQMQGHCANFDFSRKTT